MPSKIKTKYKKRILVLSSLLFLFMLISGDSPFYVGSDMFKSPKNSIDLFHLFQTVYFIPNMILPILSGFLIDYIGLSYVLIGISIFGLIGQFFMCLFMIIDSLGAEYFFVGRILYSISCETICVSVFSYVSIWFQGLKIGEYIGILFCIDGFEDFVFAFLTARVYTGNWEKPLTGGMEESKHIWLSVMNFTMAIGIVLLAGAVYKIDRIVENNENFVPALKQHPDKMMGFWKLLKKSLRQNFVIICIIYALLFTICNSFYSNIHPLLMITLWGNEESSCNSKTEVDLELSNERVHLFSFILSVISAFIRMIVPFFVGKYFIRKKKRYLAAFFGCLLITSAIIITLTILRNLCADVTIKIALFLLALLTMSLGNACQNGLLYASVALITRENHIGTRFGIIHAMKNIVCFFFTNFEMTSYRIESTDKMDFYIQHYMHGFFWYLGMVLLQMFLYLLMMARIEQKDKYRGSSTAHSDENSTFIRK